MKTEHTKYRANFLVVLLILNIVTLSSCVNKKQGINFLDEYSHKLQDVKPNSNCVVITTGMLTVTCISSAMFLWTFGNILSGPHITSLHSNNSILTTLRRSLLHTTLTTLTPNLLNTTGSNNTTFLPTEATIMLDTFETTFQSAETRWGEYNNSSRLTTTTETLNIIEPSSTITVPENNRIDLATSGDSAIPYPSLESDEEPL